MSTMSESFATAGSLIVAADANLLHIVALSLQVSLTAVFLAACAESASNNPHRRHLATNYNHLRARESNKSNNQLPIWPRRILPPTATKKSNHESLPPLPPLPPTLARTRLLGNCRIF